MKTAGLNLSISALTIFCVVAQLLGAAASFFAGVSPQATPLKTQLASAPANGFASLAEFQNSLPPDSDSAATITGAPTVLIPGTVSNLALSDCSILSAAAIAGLGLFVRAP